MTATTTAQQRRHEAPEVGAMVGRMLNALIRRAGEGDTEALEQLQYVEELARLAHTAGLVAARQDAGYSLSQLAAVEGTSRQAISQRTGLSNIDGLGAAGRCGHHACTGMRRCREAGR